MSCLEGFAVIVKVFTALGKHFFSLLNFIICPLIIILCGFDMKKTKNLEINRILGMIEIQISLTVFILRVYESGEVL